MSWTVWGKVPQKTSVYLSPFSLGRGWVSTNLGPTCDSRGVGVILPGESRRKHLKLGSLSALKETPELYTSLNCVSAHPPPVGTT